MSRMTHCTNRLIAIAVTLTSLLGTAHAATPDSSPSAKPTSTSSAARTRDQVAAEVYRAMRDGTWRCATNNRGWCGTTPQDGPPARNPR